MKHCKFVFLLGFLIVFSSCIQEKLLFYPQEIPESYNYSFNNKYQEYFIKVGKRTKINGLLFKARNSRGLIFYLHGNAGSLASWGEIADVYLQNNYDIFIVDYRGFGKSQGRISSEKQLFKDIQTAYDTIKLEYSEDKIVIVGYSIGTGIAAYLASNNNPKMLILQAPYYNMKDLAHQHMPFFPSFMIRYKLKTNEFITKLKCPLIIFHGNIDEVIYYGSSLKLKELFKSQDSLITLEGQKHNGINDNPTYKIYLKKLLE